MKFCDFTSRWVALFSWTVVTHLILVYSFPQAQIQSNPMKGITMRAFPQFQKLENENQTLEEIQKEPSLLDAVKFMRKFGYVPEGDDKAGFIFSSESLKEKLKLVQKFGALPQTGLLDEATVKLMESPRCGVHDVDPSEAIRRKKRFILGSKGWNKRRLTYTVANWSPKLYDKRTVQEELKKAFDAWSKYSHLQFTEVNNNDADIIIYFAAYHHADNYPFDGQGGILAHAYYPYEHGSLGGDIHFDESEQWTVIKPEDDPDDGLDFFTVAVHEIGHALGLAHSTVPTSIMFPYYKGYEPSFALDYDDVLGMWELYIRRKLDGDAEYFNTTTTTTTPSYDETQNDEESKDGKNPNSDEDYKTTDGGSSDADEEIRYQGDFETVDDHLKRHQKHHFDLPSLPPLSPEDDDYNRREEERKREEEARRKEEERREEERRRDEKLRREEEERRTREWEKSQTTPSTPKENIPDICDGNFDAVAKIRNEMFVFKGKYLWRYKHRRYLIPGYPSAIKNMFSGLPQWIQKIDAVYERRNDSCIIFFVGKYYYEHDGNRVLPSSPRPLTDLGIPEGITQLDAALFWPKNHKTYFFAKNLYWRRNEEKDCIDPGYSKDIKNWNGIPSDLSAATTYLNGETYFFKKNQLWKYDNDLIRPANGYPKYSMAEWTGC